MQGTASLRLHQPARAVNGSNNGGGKPFMHIWTQRTVGVSVRRNLESVEAEVKLAVPQGWTVQPAELLDGSQHQRAMDGLGTCIK